MPEAPSDDHVLPRWVRRALVPLQVLSVAVVGAVALYTRGTRVTRVDSWVDGRLVPYLEALRSPLSLVTNVAGPPKIFLACTALGALCLLFGARRAAIVLVLGPAAALVISDRILQPLIQRPGVEGAGYAYPSTHATAGFSLLLVVLLVAGPDGVCAAHLSRAVRALLCLAGTGVAVYVAAALLLLRHHYLTDIAGGAGVAVATLLAVCIVVQQVPAVWRVRHNWPRGRSRHPA